MCGIGGTIGLHRNTVDEVREKLVRPLRYRGRDSEGHWSDGECVLLVHTRLSIIDLPGGQQPMLDPTGRYHVVFNGEIYNYRELRSKYQKLGAIFATNSDTEVLLHGFALLGEQFVQDLDGMFAFAIWDSRDKQLFLARDRLGKKPLFWIQVGSDFFFSSTLASFAEIPGWDRNISKAAACMFSVLGTIPAPLTIYKGAKALPAGSQLAFRPEAGSPEIRRYWQLKFRKRSFQSTDVALDEYNSIIKDAVGLRLRADVPIGLTFSGGVDSGTIAAICKRDFNVDVPCYTIDYDVEEDRSSEVAHASAVASRLGLNWEHIQFDYHRDIAPRFLNAYANFDQPTLQFALVYSRSLYDRMKLNSTVVLSGNGADELFTGYSRDVQVAEQDAKNESLEKLPGFVHPFLRRISPERYAHWHNGEPVWDWTTKDLAATVVAYDLAPEDEAICLDWVRSFGVELKNAGCTSVMDQVMYRDLLYSASETNFRLPDVTGYSAQVEVRSPFLDHRVVEFAASLPRQLKVGLHKGEPQSKWLPKTAYSKWVGEDLAWAPKRGMGANLRWDRQIGSDGELGREVKRGIAALGDYGIDPAKYEVALQSYTNDYAQGREYSTVASIVMAGFMMGSWLKLQAG